MRPFLARLRLRHFAPALDGDGATLAVLQFSGSYVAGRCFALFGVAAGAAIVTVQLFRGAVVVMCTPSVIGRLALFVFFAELNDRRSGAARGAAL
jgi:hypothetical protein